MSTYRPKTGTTAYLAIRFLQKQHRKQAGQWVSNADLCEAVASQPNRISASMAPAIAAGLVEKSAGQHGTIQWRMTFVPIDAPRFSLGWPPGFVPRFDTVAVPAFDVRWK